MFCPDRNLSVSSCKGMRVQLSSSASQIPTPGEIQQRSQIHFLKLTPQEYKVYESVRLYIYNMHCWL
ncbi:hypothetical protein XELAEV_18044183mg [Xenopus laevis]|uniref:Uncharacterized protein n=1 Tax=Xenopus laevis TaxID=8355 RepID=A0A974BY07_XENLA|nr:hypothetical protein XELAEV_18044183mg [Xenopus laevis]